MTVLSLLVAVTFVLWAPEDGYALSEISWP
jgi:hypothetical protein